MHYRAPAAALSDKDHQHQLYAVHVPPEDLEGALSFWRLAGVGISSRLAEQCLIQLQDLPGFAKMSKFSANDAQSAAKWSDHHENICRRIIRLLQRSPTNADRIHHLTENDVYLYQSGMSAMYQLQRLLLTWRGTQSIIFGFPYELTLKMLETYGACKFYAFGTGKEIIELERHLEAEAREGRRPQAVWCECPSNPLLRTPDLRRIRSLADQYGFALVVDDSVGSFANVDVFEVADVLLTSLTKSFSGYSNVMGGR